MLKSKQHRSLIRGQERNVLYIVSFLTFFVTFCVKSEASDKKVNDN